jgi:hypothetical protein
MLIYVLWWWPSWISEEKNVSKRFFSETTWTIETKLPRNDQWMVLYKVSVLFIDRKSKMSATAIHRLTLDPMGKCSNVFFSETTNMINLVKDIPMIFHLQFGFSQFISFREEDL